MIKHGKRITETIYDGLVVKQENEIVSEQFIDVQYLLRGIIDGGLGIITSGGTRKLEIVICVDKQNRFKLTQRWKEQ